MHIPVLPRESLELLQLEKGDVVVDGTLGSGGHAELIATAIGDSGTLIGLDVDEDALERSKKKLAAVKTKLHLVQANFRNVDSALKSIEVEGVNALFLDLGWSTDQFEDSKRGFSFGSDEALIMTLEKNPNQDRITAKDIVNLYSESELQDIIYTYGEEQFSRRIASAIVSARKLRPIETTKELVTIIEAAVPKFYLFRRIHPATKTFQALRIRVNDELGALREGLSNGFKVLEEGGRFVVLTFHSLEDRIVKQTFREWAHSGLGSFLTKKPIIASEDELALNKRARSAKLRGFRKA